MALTSEIKTGDGIYTLTIEGVNTTLDPQSVTLLDEAVLRWGDSGDGWGDYILPSTLKATLYDPDFDVVPVLDALDSREATATLEGPGGFKWAGWYSAEPIKRPFFGTRGGERPTFSLLFYDGLVDARQIDFRPRFTNMTLKSIMAELASLSPEAEDPLLYSDVEVDTKFGGTYTDGDLNIRRAEPLDPYFVLAGRSQVTESTLVQNNSSLADALNGIAQALQTRLFYSPTHGRFLFVPRSRVGQSLTYHFYEQDDTVTDIALPARTRTISLRDVSQQPTYRRIKDAGVVELDLGDEHTLATEYFDATSADGEYTLAGEAGWTSYEIAEDASNELIDSPQTITLFTDEFADGFATQFVVQFDILPPRAVGVQRSVLLDVASQVQVEIKVINSQGTTTDTYTFDINESLIPEQFRAFFDWGTVQGGRMEVTWSIPTSETDVYVNIGEVRLLFADGQGEDLQRYDTYIVGDASVLPDDPTNPTLSRGEPVELEPLPYLVPTALRGGRSFPPPDGPIELHRHTLYNVERRNPHFFRAQVRAAAQSVGVRTLQAQLRGAYGPEWQLRYPGKDGLKYVTGEGRKITFSTGRIETETYDLELPTNTGDA